MDTLTNTIQQRAARAVRVPVCALRVVKESTVRYEGARQIRSSRDFQPILRELFCGLDREVFVAIALDVKKRILGINVVSIGTLDGAMVQPREAFKFAILQGAHSLVFAHNHPSGDPAPSQADRSITRRFVDCGELLGICVVDHIVLGLQPWEEGNGRFYSFCDEGTLKP